MASPFRLSTTPRFDRLARKLTERSPEFSDIYRTALVTLREDPLNRTRRHAIKNLRGVKRDEGQHRLRYDVYENEVVFRYCGLRREDTYR
ncbi:MAG: hypothetical protein QGF68_15125 [Nitrospinota bacterium]|jgi:hypothetical protein|nr:hypothetical protein [Nitrospinota bacterium]